MHSCLICGYSTPSAWNLKRHSKTHETECEENKGNDTVCRFCCKDFSNKHNRIRHEKSCPHKEPARMSAAQNVANMCEKVPHTAQNVADTAQNVAMPAQNVASESYSCDLCYKELSSMKNLMRHVKTCKGLAHPHMCPKCRIILKDRASKSRHVKTCDGTGNDQALMIGEPLSPSLTTFQPGKPTTGTGELQPITNQNYVKADTVTMNQQTNNVVINQQININGFGKEDLSAVLSPAYLDARLQELNGKGIFNMVRDVHLNPDVPENNNIRMGSKKSKTLKVFEGDGKWHVRANCDILEVLIGKYKSILTRRSHDPEFKQKLKYESDFMQIQQDLIKFDKRTNSTGYYACAHKILALIEDLEMNTTSEN